MSCKHIVHGVCVCVCVCVCLCSRACERESFVRVFTYACAWVKVHALIINTCSVVSFSRCILSYCII